MVEISQQQAEAMKEKLSKMSPEELREFQKKQCIFCQIIDGKVASKKVYSDEKCTALLDINPSNPGHILLLPNEHYSIMPLVPPDELKHLFMVAKALAQASLKALEAEGTNIFIANGVAAGQKAQHFMIHIIPRKEGDNVNINIPEKAMSESDARQVIARLKPAIAKALGPEKEEKPAEKKAEEKKEAAEEAPEKEAAEEKPAGKFITSENARRFHAAECPFAQKIPEDSRVYITEYEAEEMGKIPCGCTGLKKAKPEPVKPKKEKPKDVEEEEPEETEEVPEEEAEEEPEETEEEPDTGEGETTLDDISSMLTGGK